MQPPDGEMADHPCDDLFRIPDVYAYGHGTNPCITRRLTNPTYLASQTWTASCACVARHATVPGVSRLCTVAWKRGHQPGRRQKSTVSPPRSRQYKSQSKMV